MFVVLSAAAWAEFCAEQAHLRSLLALREAYCQTLMERLCAPAPSSIVPPKPQPTQPAPKPEAWKQDVASLFDEFDEGAQQIYREQWVKNEAEYLLAQHHLAGTDSEYGACVEAAERAYAEQHFVK